MPDTIVSSPAIEVFRDLPILKPRAAEAALQSLGIQEGIPIPEDVAGACGNPRKIAGLLTHATGPCNMARSRPDRVLRQISQADENRDGVPSVALLFGA